MKMNVGIIGYGFMGHWHQKHMPLIDGITVSTICDIDDNKRKEAENKGLKVYSDYHMLLEDLEINTVVVSVPNHLHKEVVIAAAKAKKNIICEKPAALNDKEFDEMVNAAIENKVLFSVHQNRRWDADFLAVQKVIKENQVGNVYTIGSRFFGANGLVHDWHRFKKYGGGMIYDWGVHLIDQMMCLIQEDPVSVFADVHSVINGEVDDYFKATFVFPSGLSYVIEIGTYLLYSLPRWYIAGDTGTFIINTMFDEGMLYRSKSYLEKLPETVQETKAGPTRAMAKRAEDQLDVSEIPIGNPEWSHFYMNYLEALNGREELIVRNSQVKKVLILMDAIRESSETKKSVVLSGLL